LTARFEDKLRVAHIVLRILRDGPMRWTPLTKAVLRESPTPWKTRSIIYWLLRNGYIERPERGVYLVTEKGLQFLESV